MELGFLLIVSFSRCSYLPSSQQGSKAAHGDRSSLLALLIPGRSLDHTRINAPTLATHAISEQQSEKKDALNYHAATMMALRNPQSL